MLSYAHERHWSFPHLKTLEGSFLVLAFQLPVILLGSAVQDEISNNCGLLHYCMRSTFLENKASE